MSGHSPALNLRDRDYFAADLLSNQCLDLHDSRLRPGDYSFADSFACYFSATHSTTTPTRAEDDVKGCRNDIAGDHALGHGARGGRMFDGEGQNPARNEAALLRFLAESIDD